MPCSTTPPFSPCWSCRRPAYAACAWLCGATPRTWPRCLWCAQPPARWLMTRSCGRRSCCAGMAALHCQGRLQLAEQQVRRAFAALSRCMFSRQQLHCLQCTRAACQAGRRVLAYVMTELRCALYLPGPPPTHTHICACTALSGAAAYQPVHLQGWVFCAGLDASSDTDEAAECAWDTVQQLADACSREGWCAQKLGLTSRSKHRVQNAACSRQSRLVRTVRHGLAWALPALAAAGTAAFAAGVWLGACLTPAPWMTSLPASTLL